MQATLFGRGEPRVVEVPFKRLDLGQGAWMAHIPGFMVGQDTLFDQVRSATHWQSQERQMYDRIVAVPRLLGSPTPATLPLLAPVQRFLHRHTGWTLDRISLALYRDGNDSVAFHGDRMGDLKSDCVIAILSLGCARTFLLRPAGGGRSRRLNVVGGDLLVLGGTAQQTWEHAVPKSRAGGPRIAVMFRPSSKPPALSEGGD